MVLDNESSIKTIEDALRNVDWTDEEIKDLFDGFYAGDPECVKSINLIVTSMNEALERIHVESTKKFEELLKKHEEIDQMYQKTIADMTDENGDVPLNGVVLALQACNKAKDELVKEIFND